VPRHSASWAGSARRVRLASAGQPRRRGWSPFLAGFALRRFPARPLWPRRLGSDSPG